MGLYERVASRANRKRSVPVPIVSPWQEGSAYSRDETAPAEYGDYLATSNDVYSCAWLRAKTLGVVPWQVFNRKGEDDPAHPLRALLDRPNPFTTGLKFRVAIELCLSIWGEAVVLLERGSPNPRVPPRELWWVKPTLVKAIPHRTDFISGYMFQPPGGGQPIPLRTDEVWHMSYPNPNDMYGSLPPMAAVRLAADVASQSMKANNQLFKQGMMTGGFASPMTPEQSFTVEQAAELENLIGKRFSGTTNAHRWQVLRYQLALKDMGVTPKDAEFIQGLNMTFRQVCRGMGVPSPLLNDSEYATLANLTVYDRALWEHTMEFESDFVSAEATLQLTPSFPTVSRVGLDLSNVVALQEDEQIKWSREKDQIDRGAITINEWRADQGLDPVPWGDAWWAPINVAPVSDGELPQPPGQPATAALPPSAAVRAARPPRLGLAKVEDQLRDDVKGIMLRQQDSIIRLLKQQPAVRSLQEAAEAPFDLARWVERTRAACQARFVAATELSMISEARLLNLTPSQVAELLQDRAVRAAIEGNVQQFAHRITTTTYNAVKGELEQGVRLGESLDQIADRVSHVMGIRVEEARRIAQSEITRSQTTGQLAAFQTAGILYKGWATVGDGAVRDAHMTLAGTIIPVGDMFTSGGATAYGPGGFGVAELDVGCRCWLEPWTEE